MRLVRTNSTSTDFQDLVRLLDKGLEVVDGNDHAFFSQFNKIEGIKHVIVAYENDSAVGCGAIKEYDTKTAEVKRMFVKPELRGKGIAAGILSGLENWAKELGYESCILETGNMLLPAIRLYEKSGYVQTPNYGQYIGVATSVCMAKKI